MAQDLVIHQLGPKGDGIHEGERGRIYVDRALPGEVVRADVKRGAGGVLRGETLSIVTPSPHRAAAACVHYDACGGCGLQHADAVFYREWTMNRVRDALRRAGLEPRAWAEPVFLPAGGRRRVTFAAFRKGNTVTLGYFRRRTHHITDVPSCLTADPAIMALRAKLAPALAPVLQGGKPADIFIQHVDGQFDVVITGPVGAKGRPDLGVFEAVPALAHDLKISRISWRARDRDEPELLAEINPVLVRFGALSVALPPLAFLQPTKAGEAALVDAVMAALPARGTFADLFSGCGTFTGPMLARGAVDAVDSVATAIRALDKAKDARPLRAIQRDLFRAPLTADELKRCDAVVFDPPRAGAEAQAATLALSKVPVVIGVSCDPVSFARDAKLLVDGGYRLDTVKVVDQFTWSHHVELVASFVR